MKYDEFMDKECIKLCDAINLIPGIKTIESCCGHGKGPYRIFFKAESLDALPDILYCIDGCHTGEYGWKVDVGTDCCKSPATFCIEGPVGESAYKAADVIADFIIKDVKEEAEGGD